MLAAGTTRRYINAMRALLGWFRSHRKTSIALLTILVLWAAYEALSWQTERAWQRYCAEARARGVKLPFTLRMRAHLAQQDSPAALEDFRDAFQVVSRAARGPDPHRRCHSRGITRRDPQSCPRPPSSIARRPRRVSSSPVVEQRPHGIARRATPTFVREPPPFTPAAPSSASPAPSALHCSRGAAFPSSAAATMALLALIGWQLA